MKVKLTNPAIDENGEDSARVLRSGYWNTYPNFVQVSYREDNTPMFRFNDIGFRLVRNK